MSRPRKPKGRPVSGWLILDKPGDFGSTEAVSKIKWLFNAQKAGHAGTLDPLASGMLPIALGDATKTVPYVMDGRKVYEFTVTWGEERSTDDLEGETLHSSDIRPNEASIRALLANYTGTILQVPPRFSAIKIAGERAYDLAREGEAVDIPPRAVEIFRLTLLAVTQDGRAHFEVECGKGTYVRALVRDMGRDLGCYGHVSGLRRSMVAPFEEAAMVPLAQLLAFGAIEDREERLVAADALLVDTVQALSCLPSLAVNDDQAQRLRLGNPILLLGRNAPADEPEVYATARGKLIAIGVIDRGEFRPKRVFA